MTTHLAGWFAVIGLGIAYTAMFALFYPPLSGIEDEVGFVNQALGWSRGVITSEGAGFAEVTDFGVTGSRPRLIDFVPVYRDAKSDFLVTQYSMKYVEQAGLVKFDFLGLTTLTILQRAVGFLAREGIAVDLATLPLDDPATYAMLQRADAAGVFQLEGQGMRDVLRQMRPDRFEDLIAAVALYKNCVPFMKYSHRNSLNQLVRYYYPESL